MKIRLCVAFLAWAAILSSCSIVPAPGPSERIWRGEVVVEGVENVGPEETLIIHPGTRVSFVFRDDDGDGWGSSGLLVRGRILARGSEDSPILFEPQGRNSVPGLWDGIRIESGGASRFEHCRFRGARWAIHAHFTPLHVESSRFDGNLGGVKFRGGPVRLYSSTFKHNGTAIRYWESGPEIISNILEDNGTGVFCRQGSQGTLLRGNNFIRSTDYHVKLGELQEEDVDARYNYWGSAVEGEIDDAIFDKEDVAYLGMVVYDPLEPKPFPLSEAGAGDVFRDRSEESGKMPAGGVK